MSQAAIVTYKNPDGKLLSSQLGEAATTTTMTLPAGPTGSLIRLHKLVVSAEEAAATSMLVTVKPDNSTSVVFYTSKDVGVVANLDFLRPIVGKAATDFVITCGSAGGTADTIITAQYDYQG